MDIVACYVAWNEENQMAESLRSVKAYVDRFVVIDSVFDSNPIDATHSTDRTREICESVCYPVPLTYIESDRKLSEEDARNRYLDELAEDDWVFVIDGDEVMYGDHSEVEALFDGVRSGAVEKPVSIPVYTTAVRFDGYADAVAPSEYATNATINTSGWQTRLFRNNPDMRYRGIGIYEADRAVVGTENSVVFLINHHVRQSYDGYQMDYVWESEALRRNQT